MGTLGAVTRTSPLTSLTTRPGPSPTMLSPMTNGTTRTTTSGAPRLGAKTETSSVPLPSARALPRLTGMATAERAHKLPLTTAAPPRLSTTAATATATTAATVITEVTVATVTVVTDM